MTDTAIVLGQAAVSAGRFEVVGQYATGETYGGIYPKGSPNAATLDQVIQALIDDGTLKKLAGKLPRRSLGRRSDRDPLLPAVSGDRPAAALRERPPSIPTPPTPALLRRPGQSPWAWRRRRSGSPVRSAARWPAAASAPTVTDIAALRLRRCRHAHPPDPRLRAA